MLSRPATFFSVSIASGLFLFLATQALVRGVVGSPTFLVNDLETRWPTQAKVIPEHYRLIPPNSIFRLDLEAISRALEKRYPTARVVEVERILPNRVIAFLRPSHVVAQLKADRYYLLSEEGTILSLPRGSPWPHVPVFFLDGTQGPFPIGRCLTQPGFEAAVELLAEIHRRGGMGRYGVNSIRVRGDLAILRLGSGLEVRFSQDRLSEGLDQLAELIAQRPRLLEEARYIDLRFEDPVLTLEEKVKEKS